MRPSTTDAKRGARKSTIVAGRRRFLAGPATAATVSLAGCAAVVDWIAGHVLEDVNVFNETSQRVEGSIEVAGSDGDVALSESFDLEPQPEGEEEEPEEDALAVYADVWDGPGEYEVEAELEEGSAVDGETTAAETVTLEDPEEEMLAVVLGAEDLDPIHVTVGESLTDFH